MSSIRVWGCSARQRPHVVCSDSTCLRRLATSGPSSASPVRWLHSVPVSRSNMTSELRISLPDTPKGEGLAVYLSGIHDARVTKWSPGDGNVRPTQAIVDDLDPAHESDGVGMRLASELDPDDVQVLSHGGFVRGHEMGIVNSSYGVNRENGLDLRAAQ